LSDSAYHTDTISADQCQAESDDAHGNGSAAQDPDQGPDTPFDTTPTTNDKPYYLTHKKRRLYGKRLETFERFWTAFGYKDGKAKAADAWMDIPQLTNALVEQIITAAKIEASRRQDLIASGRTPIMAQGWISQRRWEDESLQPGNETNSGEVTLLEAYRKARAKVLAEEGGRF